MGYGIFLFRHGVLMTNIKNHIAADPYESVAERDDFNILFTQRALNNSHESPPVRCISPDIKDYTMNVRQAKSRRG